MISDCADDDPVNEGSFGAHVFQVSDPFDEKAQPLNRPENGVQTEETPEDVFREWEDRYSAQPVSQADFFLPNWLHSSRSDSHPKADLADDDDIPLDPTVPRIVIIGPEVGDADPSFERPSSLKKAAPLVEKKQLLNESSSDLKHRPKARERRHSTISLVPERQKVDNSASTSTPKGNGQKTPTPRPWTATETYPKGGWRMRSRCSAVTDAELVVDIVMVYLYHSALCDKSRDRDADLDIFRHFFDFDVTVIDSAPVRKIRRARTDIGKQARQETPFTSSHTPNQSSGAQPWTGLQKHQTKPVNWLQDHDMLRKHIPGSRIITVGFDIAPVLSVDPDFEAAAGQLNDYLQEMRKQQQAPIILLGHTLGGLIILHSLALASLKAFSAQNLLSHTAGVFLFATSTKSSENRARVLADLYGAKASDKIFNDFSGSPTMERLRKLAKTRFASRSRVRSKAMSASRGTQALSNAKRIAIEFPITQFFARGDNQNSPLDSLSAFLGASIRTVTLSRELPSALQFSSAQDADFLRIVALIRSALQTCHLLHAAVAGDLKEIETLIQEGVNPNLRDRRCVLSQCNVIRHLNCAPRLCIYFGCISTTLLMRLAIPSNLTDSLRSLQSDVS